MERLLGNLPSGINLCQLNLGNPKQPLCVLESALLGDPGVAASHSRNGGEFILRSTRNMLRST